VVRRGEVVICDFGDPQGHEAGFRRPALVISPSEVNQFGTPVVIPLTRTRRGYPTHVELDGVLPDVSYAQCELLRAISLDRVGRRIGEAGLDHLLQIEKILHRILGFRTWP